MGTTSSPYEGFEHVFDLRQDARRFEESSISPLDTVAFGVAIELLLEVGGKTVEEQVLSLSRQLAEGLAARGHEVVEPWPRELAESSGIVSFRRPSSPAHQVLRDLQAAGIVGRLQSDFVRLSPHFYNTREDVEHVLDVLQPLGAALS
jgi:selenocysteine lyase/cysteine desulfurase